MCSRFSLAAFTLASIGRSMTLGVRARRRASHEALSDGGGAHGARQPAPLRRICLFTSESW
jgi:hypothetical protein